MSNRSLVKGNRFGISPSRRSSYSTMDDAFADLEWAWNYIDKIWANYDLVPAEKGVEYPKINIFEYSDRYVVEIAIAGFSKDEVKVILKDNQITISGKHISEEFLDEEDSFSTLRREISRKSFDRIVGFPKEVDKHTCQASYDNGIIKVVVNKVLQPEHSDEVEIKF